jgi:hypothetical protein
MKYTLLSLLLMLFCFSAFAIKGQENLDQDPMNYSDRLGQFEVQICRGQKTFAECDLYRKTKDQIKCTQRKVVSCRKSLNDMKASGPHRVYKPIVNTLDTLYELKTISGAKFNSNYVKACKAEYGESIKNRENLKDCIKVLADNAIAPKLFQFCNFNITCLSRLRDLTKVGGWIGKSNFDSCRSRHTGFGLIECARNTVETKGHTEFVKKIGDLEYKLNECQQKNSGISVETDMQKLTNDIKNNLYSGEALSGSKPE